MIDARKMRFAVALICMATVLGTASAQEDSSAGASAVPEGDFNGKLKPAFSFSPNVLALMGGTLDLSELFYGNFWGRRLTVVTLNTKGSYGSGFFFRDGDGNRIDPFGTEARSATWMQLFGTATLSASQGLIPALDPDCWSKNLLGLTVSYGLEYSHKVEAESPDSMIFASGLPDADVDVLRNIATISLDFDDYRTSKAYNLREGAIGSISFAAAPRALLNDKFGLSDYYRFCADFRTYLPIVRSRVFSMYVSQSLSYDAAWGDYLPVDKRYSPSSQGQPVRAVPFYSYDGYAHATGQLELRMSFPNLVDTGAMPGFSFFYDCGLYDDYDYAFSLDRFAQAAGACFVMHMDSITLLPFSAQLDLQAGISFDIGREEPGFYWAMFFPNEIQL